MPTTHTKGKTEMPDQKDRPDDPQLEAIDHLIAKTTGEPPSEHRHFALPAFRAERATLLAAKTAEVPK
jgi:hypothetical protein